MKINIFYPKNIISIRRSFEPLIRFLKTTYDITEYELPYEGGNPINIWRNIYFVYKHRTKIGVNHITGDAHYCILGLIGVPSVLTIHDDYAMRFSHRGLFDKFYKWFMWLALPIYLAREVVCISPKTYTDIRKYVKTSKMCIISHHCMNEDFEYSERVFNTNEPTILQIGTLPHKNLETTLYALNGVKCKLHVIREMTDSQIKLAKKLQIKYDNLYNLTNEEVIEEYKKADIVVFPSEFEGFGMPIVEAQATGRVIVTTNRAPMNWVAGKKGAVFIDNPQNAMELKNAITMIIKNDHLRNSCIEYGLENVQRFSLSAVNKAYRTIYQRSLSVQ